jgi:phosphoglycolate phosphatase-like HAD superfamily hydrolase
LASKLAKPLVGQASLDVYLSSLRSTHGSDAWIFDLFHALGRPERAVASALAAEPGNRDIDAVVKALDNFQADSIDESTPPRAVAEKVREIAQRLHGLGSDLASVSLNRDDSITRILQTLVAEIERFKADLRFIRDSEIR